MTATAARSVRGLAAKAAPVLSQGITAGTSLVLQILAARALGLAEFGAFALLLALLVTASGLYTGGVGDALAVLDRHDPATRAGIAASALGCWALCLAVAVGTALVVAEGEPWVAAAFAAMVVLRLAAETARRLLMARLEFWRLVVNDTAHLVVTLVAVGIFAATGRITLLGLLASMAMGAGAAVLTGILQLPADELRRVRPGRAALAQVLSFAAWRSLQAALRPAALLASRVLVSAFLSLAAVGALEAGRLVVAPLQVVINGAGGFLLSDFAARERQSAARAHGRASRAAKILLLGTGIGGISLALLSNPLGRLLTGSEVDPLLVLGWVAYLMSWAAGLPHVTEAVARRKAREVFLIRLVDSLLGLALVAAALLWWDGVAVVPWLMACGGAYSSWRVRRLAIRSRA
ncbi:hypothetical protein [Saccharopolyspora taberi]|uniref:Membrane protein involved in the export of O-antigen and teichoic acid n=1 Tax=Saccharopolyspora taberi TaxID=60895 RepID=A0ABN3VE25_9PSEU